MNTLADTIRDELKKARENSASVKTADKVWGYEPTKRECAAIPCAYLGVSIDSQDYCKPKKEVCAALPNIYELA